MSVDGLSSRHILCTHCRFVAIGNSSICGVRNRNAPIAIVSQHFPNIGLMVHFTPQVIEGSARQSLARKHVSVPCMKQQFRLAEDVPSNNNQNGRHFTQQVSAIHSPGNVARTCCPMLPDHLSTAWINNFRYEVVMRAVAAVGRHHGGAERREEGLDALR